MQIGREGKKEGNRKEKGGNRKKDKKMQLIPPNKTDQRPLL